MFALSAYRADQAMTFSQQDKLPRLPVPDLDKSLEGYLRSLVPVMEQKYGTSSLSKELEKRRIFARDFAAPGGLGRTLQERLRDLDSVSPNNWLNDTLWLRLAYHTWRAPLVVNSNWWLLFAPDPNDRAPPTFTPPGESAASLSVLDPNPREARPSGSQGGGAEWLKENQTSPAVPAYEDVTRVEDISDWQIRRAAWVVRRFAELRLKLQREEIPPDASKAGPFCMEQYRHMFNFARIPMVTSDAFSVAATHALHATLLIDDFIYSVDIFVPASSADGFPEPLSAGQIEANIQAAVEDARRRRDVGEEPDRIGLLTADERDMWMQNRERLLLLSPQNRATLHSISTSLLAISLDPYTLPSVVNSDPLRLPYVDAQIRNTATGIHGGQNRWYDKSISLVFENTGRGGLMGEHSPVDALIPSIAVEYAIGKSVDESQFDGAANKGKFERLDWAVDEGLRAEVEACRGRNQALIGDSDASQLWFGEYAVEWIKKIGKQSPDAFIQQALQLAWYRDQRYATATYETASTRGMKHGRTDVIRTLSTESRDFVKAMVDESVDDAKRYALLTTACTTHNALTRISSAGHGFDRHLMGLKVMLRPGETHALFDDEMYAKSQEWKLSTSGLSAGGSFNGTGFGAAWPDGYGINYLAGPYLIKFGIESKHSCPVTSTAKFKHQVVQALRDMRRVCEASAGSSAQKAKI